MESFLGISRLGIGGKHFPGMFSAAVRGAQQPGCPCSPWEWMRTGGSRGWGWLTSSLGAIIDLNVYLGKLCCSLLSWRLQHTEMSCWEVVLDASWLAWRPLHGDLSTPSAACAAAGPVWSFTCIQQPLVSSPTQIAVVKADFCSSVGL